MWYLCNLILSVALAQNDFHSRRMPSIRSSTAGPIRIKYLNVDNLNVDLELEYATNYFHHAVNMYNRLTPITLSCGGYDINVEDADVVIIFEAACESHPNGFKAITCANEDSPMQYPLAGIISSNNLKKFELLPLIVASTIRVLALDFGQIDLWKKNQQGDLYDSRPIIEAVSNSRTKQYLNSPQALQKLKEAFSAPELIGIELEDHPSTQGMVFWELRHFRLEVMSLGVPYDLYVGTFTLGALEDSAWYFPNYEMGNLPYFGRDKGAEYFNIPCKYGESGVDDKLWCVNELVSSFGPLHLSIASCGTAGSYPDDSLADGCPYSQNKFEICRYPPNMLNAGMNGRAVNVYESSINMKWCVQVLSCTDTAAKIKYLTYIIDCPFTGDRVKVPNQDIYIDCPGSTVLCDIVPCYNLCNGNGKCVSGSCHCFTGYSGEFCDIKCPENCGICSSSSVCNSCKDGYYMSGGICVKCQEPCLTCSSAVSCISCSVGRFLSGSNCDECPAVCSDCSDFDTCTECIFGHHLVGSICCPIGCSNCVTAYCTQCDENYLFDQGNCLPCPTSCFHCINGVCEGCSENYLLDDENCITCPVWCHHCSNDICEKCAENYYLKNGRCEPCQDWCKHCINNICEGCAENYLLLGQECITCPSWCNHCKNDICEVCAENYLLENSNCITCPSWCKHCINNLCEECAVGFYFEGQICLECPSNCLECLSSSTCITCDDGYYMNSHGICTYCQESCELCKENTCNSCKSGYHINGRICCNDWCDGCNELNCFNCIPGKYFNQGICEECPDSCEVCLYGKCQKCKNSWYLDAQECYKCDSSCETCTKEKCLTCKETLFLSDGKCVSCPTSCDACSAGICQECIKGFYLEGGICINCPDECLGCSNQHVCSDCKSNYYLTMQLTCLPCPDACSKCYIDICFECLVGYQIKKGKCVLIEIDSDDKDENNNETDDQDNDEKNDDDTNENDDGTNDQDKDDDNNEVDDISQNPSKPKCEENCLSCSASMCFECIDKFFPEGRKCNQCSNNCIKCRGEWDCTFCESGFEVDYGICCPNTCSSCSTTACYSCKNKYFLSSGKCIDCPDSCKTCLHGFCIDCKNGFFISGTICSECVEGCSSCSSLVWCDSCKGGYKLKAGKCTKTKI